MPAPPKPARATWLITPASMLDVRLTANARPLASRQADAFKSHDHPELGARYDTSTTAGITTILHKGVETLGLINTGPAGGAETRPRNVAYHPRLHA